MQTKSNIQLIIEQKERQNHIISAIEKYLEDNNLEQSFLLFENFFDSYNNPSFRIDSEVIKAKSELQGFSMVPDKYLNEDAYYTCIQSYHKPFNSVRELVEELFSDNFKLKFFDPKTGKFIKTNIGIGIYDNRNIDLNNNGEPHTKKFYLMEYNANMSEYGQYLKESGLENNHKVKIIIYNPVRGYIYL